MKSHNFTGWHDLTCHCLQAGCRLALDSTWKSLDGESGEWGTNGWGVLTDAFDPPRGATSASGKSCGYANMLHTVTYSPNDHIFYIWTNPGWDLSSRLCLAGIRQSQRVGLGKEFRPRPKNGGIVWKTNMEMVGKSHGKSHRCSHRSIETWWRNVINGGCSLHYHLVI